MDSLSRYGYLRHNDESSECTTARQHSVPEVACYRIERTLMGCADPLRTISVLELTKNEVDGGSLSRTSTALPSRASRKRDGRRRP